jgi:hypothetical protein
VEIGARFVENDAMVGSEDEGWVVVDRSGRRAADHISGLLAPRRRVAPLPGHASRHNKCATANNNNNNNNNRNDGNQAPVDNGPRRRVQRRAFQLQHEDSTLGDPDHQQVVTAFLPPAAGGQRAPAIQFRTVIDPDHGACAQICVWTLDCTAPTVWDRAVMACNQPVATCGVLKIQRVLQPIGSMRFDLFCVIRRSVPILHRLQQFSGRWGWHCRFHAPFLKRHPPGAELMRADPMRHAQRRANALLRHRTTKIRLRTTRPPPSRSVS